MLPGAIVITSNNILTIVAVVLLVAIVAAKWSSRFGMPTLILFLFVGMTFGRDGIGIEFDNPGQVQFVGMLALCVILFSGGMETSYKDIKPIALPGILLSTVGVFLTAIIAGGFIFYISKFFHLELTFLQSLLLASLFSSTDSASVFSILRAKKLGLKQHLKPMLEFESGSNDPVAYMLMIILISVIMGGEHINTWQALWILVRELGVGALAGFFIGNFTVRMVNNINLDNHSLYSTLLLAQMFLCFTITKEVGGNEYLSVYIMGLVVGNHKMTYQRTMNTFFDGLTWLFQIVMFVMLGLLVNPAEMLRMAPFGVAIAVFVMLFARPISVFLSLLPFRKITRRAKLFVSWVGLRGAVPIIFATYPLVENVPHANIMFDTVFLITIISLLVQGTTLGWVAKKLGLAQAESANGLNMGFDIPENMQAALKEMSVDAKVLECGELLKNIPLEENQLVMMIERDGKHIVPRGTTRLQLGDKLLMISTNEADIAAESVVRRAYRHRRSRVNHID